MGWTEESIVAEFKLHVAYWQKKLRLQDIAVRVAVVDYINKEDNAWCSVTRDNGGANAFKCYLRIRRGRYADETRRDVWKTCAHEMVHVMNWSMSCALDNLTDWYSTAQFSLANSLLKNGNEELAYKWEEILSDIFAADAPLDEIPDEPTAAHQSHPATTVGEVAPRSTLKCVDCGNDLHGTHFGAGDGTGQRFRCEQCHLQHTIMPRDAAGT